MKQREVADEDTRWTCVQAFSMSETEIAEKATGLAESEAGRVTVVCTPSGGAKTVRIELPADWDETMQDDALLAEIRKNAS